MNYTKIFIYVLLLMLIILMPGQHLKANNFKLQENLYRWFQIDDPFYLYQFDLKLHSGSLLRDFYRDNSFQPVWVTDRDLNSIGKEFLKILEDSRGQGFLTEEYHLSTIKDLRMELIEEGDEDSNHWRNLLLIDLLLSDAFFVYSSDIQQGRVDSEQEQRVWIPDEENDYLAEALGEVIEQGSVQQVLVDLKKSSPRLPEYKILKEKLIQYRRIKERGGWPTPGPGAILEKGDSSSQIEIIWKRLEQEPGWDFNENAKSEEEFNQSLQQAVFNFQNRYGLALTGRIDEATRKALNTTTHEVIRRIAINLERLRWLNQNPEQTYVLVNIPEFRLSFRKQGDRKWEKKVIVGKERRQTPVFSTEIIGLLFNPRWYIPRSIAVKDFLPQLKKDSSYLDERKIKVYQKEDSRFEEVEPESIDWEDLSQSNFEYYLWQDSGPWNALGDVIFQSPNKHHIYLHDTPNKHLFNHRVRTYSSGCIRVQDALEMAEYFIDNYTHLNNNDMGEILDQDQEIDVSLNRGIPLHFMYMTAWIDGDGNFRMFPDIYQKDNELQQLYFRHRN